MNPPRYGSVSRKSNLLSHIHAFSWWGLWKQVKLKGMGNLETTGRSVGFGESEARVPCCGSTTVTCSQGWLVLPRELQSRQALKRCPEPSGWLVLPRELQSRQALNRCPEPSREDSLFSGFSQHPAFEPGKGPSLPSALQTIKGQRGSGAGWRL